MPQTAPRANLSGWEQPPVVIGCGPRWLIVWLGSALTRGGDWQHAYSIAPGLVVTVTARPGESTLPPHDNDYTRILGPIIDAIPYAAGAPEVPNPRVSQPGAGGDVDA